MCICACMRTQIHVDTDMFTCVSLIGSKPIARQKNWKIKTRSTAGSQVCDISAASTWQTDWICFVVPALIVWTISHQGVQVVCGVWPARWGFAKVIEGCQSTIWNAQIVSFIKFVCDPSRWPVSQDAHLLLSFIWPEIHQHASLPKNLF